MVEYPCQMSVATQGHCKQSARTSRYSGGLHSTRNALTVISMYFHPHSTHSTPSPDTPGALWYHPGDHPCFLPLCHPPDILVSNPCLNSSDLGTSGPWDLQTLGPSDLRTLLALLDPCSCSSTSV